MTDFSIQLFFTVKKHWTQWKFSFVLILYITEWFRLSAEKYELNQLLFLNTNWNINKTVLIKLAFHVFKSDSIRLLSLYIGTIITGLVVLALKILCINWQSLYKYCTVYILHTAHIYLTLQKFILHNKYLISSG